MPENMAQTYLHKIQSPLWPYLPRNIIFGYLPVNVSSSCLVLFREENSPPLPPTCCPLCAGPVCHDRSRLLVVSSCCLCGWSIKCLQDLCEYIQVPGIDNL